MRIDWERVGIWVMGCAIATGVAAVVAAFVFSVSYYKTWHVSEEGWMRYAGDGFAIPYLTAFWWSAIGCVGLWTLWCIGWAIADHRRESKPRG